MDKVQNLFEIMYSRGSIRCYQEDKPVEHDHHLLKAAMAAPSATAVGIYCGQTFAFSVR